jgi:hypothetical protein
VAITLSAPAIAADMETTCLKQTTDISKLIFEGVFSNIIVAIL